MDRFESMAVFGKVVASGSFSNAARQMHLSQAAVSKHVRALEEWLGTPLLNRTTRKVSLTEFGRVFHERCLKILEELDYARDAASEVHKQPKGTLRITAPIPFGERYLPALVSEFLRLHPEISFQVALTDRRIDLVEEGFDLAIRVGRLPDTTMVARRLASSRFVACASSDYIRRFGEPREPGELSSHQCLIFTHHYAPTEWRFVRPDGDSISVPVVGRVKSNNADLLLAAAKAGDGILLAPTFHVGADLASGALAPVLIGWTNFETTVQAVYPHTRHLSAKVRTFVDFLVEKFKTACPWENDVPPKSNKSLAQELRPESAL
jgi:DNA-binding transcriptional LysR family regulator